MSLRAHTDELQILADKDVTVISVNGEIHITAKEKIEIVGADSSIVLDGGDITFTTPGTWAAKASAAAMMGGASAGANIGPLPTELAAEPAHWLALHYLDPESGESIAHADYEIHLQGGALLTGTLNAQGQAQHLNVSGKAVKKVVYKPRKPDADPPHNRLNRLLG
jgi:type VI secretion system secreted protein VgrG